MDLNTLWGYINRDTFKYSDTGNCTAT